MNRIMKKESAKLAVVCAILSVIALLTAIFPFAADSGTPTAFSFISTQYTYTAYRESWLRNLIVKEDILTPSGVLSPSILKPVTDYPYTQTEASFAEEVASYVDMYTLDDDSQKAAYLYLFRQLDALTIISEPSVSDDAKIAYLKNEGIVIPGDVKDDSTKMLMVGALYAFMRNDFHYVVSGEPEPEIPRGTGLEEALMMYMMTVSGQGKVLPQFVSKYFGVTVTTLDDYVYYSTLYTLWVNGYVKSNEISTIPRGEVYRRMAIFEIEQHGITIDASTATDEELRLKYMCAGLGDQYRVDLNWQKLGKHLSANSVPFYILQLIGNKEGNLTLPDSYTYEKAFSKVCKNTTYFDLSDKFYADIASYTVKLDYKRDTVSFRATPLFRDDAEKGTSVKITLSDGTPVAADAYETITLSGKARETISIIVRYFQNGVQKNAFTYKLNIIQGGGDTSEPNTLTNPIQTWTVPTDTSPPTTSVSIPNITANPSDILTVNGSVVSLGGDIINQLYSTDINGNYIDASGNVVASFDYNTLPAGYAYTVYDDDSVGIVQIGNTDVTNPGTTSKSEGGFFKKLSTIADNWLIFLLFGGVSAVFIGLGITLLLVMRKKNKKNKNKSKNKNKKTKK